MIMRVVLLGVGSVVGELGAATAPKIGTSKYQSNIPNKTTRIAVSRVESTGTIETKLLIKMNLIMKLIVFRFL